MYYKQPYAIPFSKNKYSDLCAAIKRVYDRNKSNPPLTRCIFIENDEPIPVRNYPDKFTKIIDGMIINAHFRIVNNPTWKKLNKQAV